VPKGHEKDYEIVVNDLGANILRSGLCAATAAVQRLGDRGNVLLDHLASAGVPGLEGAAARFQRISADVFETLWTSALALAEVDAERLPSFPELAATRRQS
jgi:hypothetical protein